jgi:serine protease SohB
MEILLDLGSFAAKVLLLTLAATAVLVVIANLVHRMRPPREQLEVEILNDKYENFAEAIKESTLSAKELKAERKLRAKKEKAEKKAPVHKPKLFVLNFDGDLRASEVDRLRDEITAILTAAAPGDEVVVKIESTGGMVHSYGLAASQMLRLRDHGIKVTACVDKVAASGGYMMACTADKVIAAPFAIVGSIGVVAQVPNFHRVLKKHDIDYEELTAGEFKRTISLLGEITPKGKQKFVEQLEDTHKLFKEFVQKQRPKANLDQVATGEYWFGQRALDLGLVDELMSSDDYLYRSRERATILEMTIEWRKSFGEKMAENFSAMTESALSRWQQKLHDEKSLL